ncbi:hypothetical protein 32HC_20 [Mycobacterium phage 32HC]|uniref:Ribosomal protein L9 domain-containing protein n=1 Tax=Mycobacterium phage 32HC TaxID=1445729 RepID=W8EAD5_9CAUD|nr:hypothetical protein ST32HC_20 [Mycobacterium phage 32HC]AHJ86298.1 hypothetical protein 32HC_20 [Mycobacterium phage 32HC]
MKVILTKPIRSRQAGEVLDVDSGSAKNMVEKRKVAQYFDPDKHKQTAERTAPRRGNVNTTQVVEADEPAAPSSANVDAGEPGQTAD